MLRSSIRFLNVDSSAALKKRLAKHLQTLERRFGSLRRRILVDLRLLNRARRPNGTLKRVQAEILLKIPGKGLKVVKKYGRDARKISKQAIDTVEKILRRESEKTVAGRRTIGKTKRAVRKVKRAQKRSR